MKGFLNCNFVRVGHVFYIEFPKVRARGLAAAMYSIPCRDSQTNGHFVRRGQGESVHRHTLRCWSVHVDSTGKVTTCKQPCHSEGKEEKTLGKTSKQNSIPHNRNIFWHLELLWQACPLALHGRRGSLRNQSHGAIEGHRMAGMIYQFLQ